MRHWFEHNGERADQACDCGLVGEDPDDIGAALDFLVQALERIRGMDLCCQSALKFDPLSASIPDPFVLSRPGAA